MRKLVLVAIILIVLLLVFFVARSATPVVDLPAAVTSLGQVTPITVHVRDPRGIRRLQAFVEQNDTRYQVFDHGYGLQTIYGHLSRIDVHEGDTLSGQTGMAGGDHIHFAMQLDGVQID